jgi:hypothetical protein
MPATGTLPAGNLRSATVLQCLLTICRRWWSLIGCLMPLIAFAVCSSRRVTDLCYGFKCLVAWDNVCRLKDIGGLAIKNLKLQNQCLLLKFAVKLLHGNHVPWITWCCRGSNPVLILSLPPPQFTWATPTILPLTYERMFRETSPEL